MGTGLLPMLAICAGTPSFKKNKMPGKGSLNGSLTSEIFITGSQLICGSAYNCTSLLVACTSSPLILMGLAVLSSATVCVLSKTNWSLEKPKLTPIKSALVLTSNNINAFLKGEIPPCDILSFTIIIACISVFSNVLPASLFSVTVFHLLFWIAMEEVRLLRTLLLIISWLFRVPMRMPSLLKTIVSLRANVPTAFALTGLSPKKKLTAGVSIFCQFIRQTSSAFISERSLIFVGIKAPVLLTNGSLYNLLFNKETLAA